MVTHQHKYPFEMLVCHRRIIPEPPLPPLDSSAARVYFLVRTNHVSLSVYLVLCLSKSASAVSKRRSSIGSFPFRFSFNTDTASCLSNRIAMISHLALRQARCSAVLPSKSAILRVCSVFLSTKYRMTSGQRWC